MHVILDLSIVLISLLQKIDKCPAGFGSFLLVSEDLFFGKADKTAVFFRQIIRVIVFGISPFIRRQEMPNVTIAKSGLSSPLRSAPLKNDLNLSSPNSLRGMSELKKSAPL